MLGPSPPSCAFTSGAASQQTAADMETVWTDAVGVRMAGRAPPVTLWCVSRKPAVATVSALLVSMQCDVRDQQNHQVQVYAVIKLFRQLLVALRTRPSRF